MLRPPQEWGDFAERDFPFFSSVLDARGAGLGLPADNLTPRGLILNLGSQTWACFDVDLLRVSAIWTGPGVTPVSMSQVSYHSPGVKAPEGQEQLPQIPGEPWIANGIYPGWQSGESISLADPRETSPDPKEVGRGPLPARAGSFRAIRINQDGAELEYQVAETPVRETIRAWKNGTAVSRSFLVEKRSAPLWILLGRLPAGKERKFQMVAAPGEGKQTAELRRDPTGLWTVRVAPGSSPARFAILFGAEAGLETASGLLFATESGARVSRKRWPQAIETGIDHSTAMTSFALDEFSLPLKNPWKRNLRLADIAFFADGKAAAVTFDGDVWTISGLAVDSTKLVWRRFASGFHEPLSLAIRAGELFVFDRNGIWRLRDESGAGEATVHELFSTAAAQTAETREYANSMKLAPDGSFLIAKGGQQTSSIGRDNGSILRISADGKTATVLGRGLRQPFLSVHPKTGLILATDQQGHYVPATPIHLVREGQYYGFLSSLLPKEKYPAPIADPITWIPHPINPSAATQVWLTDAKMGPLNSALIHFGYYRPELFLVLLNEKASRLQGAVLSLTRDLQFAPLSGAVNPADGQLYFTGFQIWGTVAPQISGLARLRYTGGPSPWPKEIVPMDQGILLRFDQALDPVRATSPANFSAERWNYLRTANYGSPHFKPDGSKGQEWMRPGGVYLAQNRKAVFVGFRGMKPVMQMRLGWTLAWTNGDAFEQNAYFTPHELVPFDSEREGFGKITVNLDPSGPSSIQSTPITVAEGKRITELMGCVACHSTDGSTLGKVGPSWKGLFGSEREFSDRTKGIADEQYLRESIREPGVKVVRGFEKSDTGMPSYEGVVTDAQLEALILYLKSL